MNPAVQYNEGTDTYELGIEVDGTFVSVYTIAGSTVRSRIEAVKSAESAASQTSGEQQTGTQQTNALGMGTPGAGA